MSRPTHVVTVKVKDNDAPASKVGVAWLNQKGWMSIRLNPCVTLTDRDDIYINVYPDKYRDQPPRQEQRQRSWAVDDQADDHGPPPYGDEDVPF